MAPKFELIAAMEENWGIGKDGRLPWHIPSEAAYYFRICQTLKDLNKRHVAIFGRRTWDSIPESMRPWKNSINFILSSTLSQQHVEKYPETYVCRTLDDIVQRISQSELADRIERVWVHGGYEIYKKAMESQHFYRIYLTKIYKSFPADAFFPEFDETKVKIIEDPETPKGIQTDGDVQYEVFVYETINLNPVLY